jgi:hypothetical protein
VPDPISYQPARASKMQPEKEESKQDREDHEMREVPRCYPRSLMALLLMILHLWGSLIRIMFEFKWRNIPITLTIAVTVQLGLRSQRRIPW